MVTVFDYDISDLSERGTKWNENSSNNYEVYGLSSFDKLLIESWNKAVKAGMYIRITITTNLG